MFCFNFIEQDEGLEALSKVIERQKLMGKSIGNELDYHNGNHFYRPLIILVKFS